MGRLCITPALHRACRLWQAPPRHPLKGGPSLTHWSCMQLQTQPSMQTLQGEAPACNH